MLPRKPVQRLAGDELLRDLALECDAVGSMARHGLSSYESPAPGQFLNPDPSAPRGPLQSREAILSRADVDGVLMVVGNVLAIEAPIIAPFSPVKPWDVGSILRSWPNHAPDRSLEH
jgi:hypothetical protein